MMKTLRHTTAGEFQAVGDAMVAQVTRLEPRRLSLKEQQQRLREDVILQAVNGLLAEKGFDLMTVDEVAAVVGIAKASLYKHFESKEMLAAAAMVRLLERTLEVIKAQPEPATPIDKLKAVVRWAVREHLAGQMPALPSTRSTLRDALVKHKPYIDRLIEASDLLGAWIETARERGEIAPSLPPEVVLYTLYARACDPVSDYLKLSGNFRDEEIVELVTATCFDGLAARPS
jgi:TetR/AcrR family transcriptional regulator of autoinduction and epiphytic fitness